MEDATSLKPMTSGYLSKSMSLTGSKGVPGRVSMHFAIRVPKGASRPPPTEMNGWNVPRPGAVNALVYHACSSQPDSRRERIVFGMRCQDFGPGGLEHHKAALGAVASFSRLVILCSAGLIVLLDACYHRKSEGQTQTCEGKRRLQGH